MNVNSQFQSFFQCLDCQAKCWSKRCCPPLQDSYVWIVVTWQIVSNAGWLDALCSFIASKQGAKSCALVVSNYVEDCHLEVYYEGLQRVAVALGNILSLEYLRLMRCWYEYTITDKFNHHSSCVDYCKAFSTDSTKRSFKVDCCLESIVLKNVRQIKEFCSWPELGLWVLPNTSYHIKGCTKPMQQPTALAQAMANHPQLHDLQFDALYDLLPEHFHVWQELFCNGIARMKKLQRLSLAQFPVWTTTMIQALQHVLPYLSNLSIICINTTEEWMAIIRCVIYGRRLTTLRIRLKYGTPFHFEGNKRKYIKLMEGVLAMNLAGRAYVLDDAMNKRKMLGVLASVKDNLDCLYIHLRESLSF